MIFMHFEQFLRGFWPRPEAKLRCVNGSWSNLKFANLQSFILALALKKSSSSQRFVDPLKTDRRSQ